MLWLDIPFQVVDATRREQDDHNHHEGGREYHGIFPLEHRHQHVHRVGVTGQLEHPQQAQQTGIELGKGTDIAWQNGQQVDNCAECQHVAKAPRQRMGELPVFDDHPQAHQVLDREQDHRADLDEIEPAAKTAF